MDSATGNLLKVLKPVYAIHNLISFSAHFEVDSAAISYREFIESLLKPVQAIHFNFTFAEHPTKYYMSAINESASCMEQASLESDVRIHNVPPNSSSVFLEDDDLTEHCCASINTSQSCIVINYELDEGMDTLPPNSSAFRDVT